MLENGGGEEWGGANIIWLSWGGRILFTYCVISSIDVDLILYNIPLYRIFCGIGIKNRFFLKILFVFFIAPGP